MESAALTGAEKPKENSNAHLYEDAQPSGGSDKLDSPSDKVESGSDQLSSFVAIYKASELSDPRFHIMLHKL